MSQLTLLHCHFRYNEMYRIELTIVVVNSQFSLLCLDCRHSEIIICLIYQQQTIPILFQQQNHSLLKQIRSLLRTITAHYPSEYQINIKSLFQTNLEKCMFLYAVQLLYFLIASNTKKTLWERGGGGCKNRGRVGGRGRAFKFTFLMG